MEIVGDEVLKEGNSNCEVRSLRLKSWEVHELNFLVNYDKTKKAIQNIIDMPDRLIDLFIHLCLQNDGRLSTRKKSSHFKFLTDKELVEMEQVVKNGYAHNI